MAPTMAVCIGSGHKNTTTQDFVIVMSGWVFGIAMLLYIDTGVCVPHRPTKLGPSRHFRSEMNPDVNDVILVLYQKPSK